MVRDAPCVRPWHLSNKGGLARPMSHVLPEHVLQHLAQHPACQLVDARGLRCPMPVLKLGKAARETPDVPAFLLLASDEPARLDVPAFCAEKNWPHELLTDDQGLMVFRVQTTAL
jgi:tRNA 2-thiouridine synthesizing protein A